MMEKGSREEDAEGGVSEKDMDDRDGEAFGTSVDVVGVCDGIGIGKVIEFHQSSSCILFSSIPDATNNIFTPRGTKNVMGRSSVERELRVRRASRWRWS
jgi:hypothetical protein